MLFSDFCRCPITTLHHAKHNIRKIFNYFKVNRNMKHWITALCTGGTDSRFLLFGLEIWVIDFTPFHVLKFYYFLKYYVLNLILPSKSTLKKRLTALHLSFNIAFYVCSRMFAWLSQAQEEISLRHISSQGTSGGDICIHVYSGNKTCDTGMDQVVPWCNLWILPIKCRFLSPKNPFNPCKLFQT